jgi:hypothetical protein
MMWTPQWTSGDCGGRNEEEESMGWVIIPAAGGTRERERERENERERERE